MGEPRSRAGVPWHVVTKRPSAHLACEAKHGHHDRRIVHRPQEQEHAHVAHEQLHVRFQQHGVGLELWQQGTMVRHAGPRASERRSRTLNSADDCATSCSTSNANPVNTRTSANAVTAASKSFRAW